MSTRTNQTTPLYTLKQLVDLNIQNIPFLWQDYLPKQGFGILTGPSDSSKSTFVRQLAFAIAQRSPQYLSKQLFSEKSKVLIVATEDGKIATAAVIRKQMAHQLPEAVQSNVFFYFKPMRDVVQLEEIITQNPVDLIILDTWTDSFREDINSAIKVRENLEVFNELAERHNCFILGIHHNRKGGDPNNPNKQNVLGSMAIEAYSRAVLDLRVSVGQENKRRLTIVKGNYVPDILKQKPVILDLNPETLHLSLAAQQPAYGFEATRIKPNAKNEFYDPVITLYIKGSSLDAIVKHLKDTYPEIRTPSKGTIHNWIQEYKNSQSQNNRGKSD